jgi:hypothetical protein
MDLFPDIGLDKSKFWVQFRHSVNRKKFFKNYAKANAFNPLNADQWYSQTREQIMSTKVSLLHFTYVLSNLQKT